MEIRSAQQPASYHLPCNCGAPRPALRLAFIAAIVALIVGLLIAGARTAGAAAPEFNPVAGAPMKINRWGYIAEQIQGEACLLGVMKQSDEESIEEAKSGRSPD